MPARLDLVTLDSPRPDEAARFWSAALGLHEVEREDGDRWIVLAGPDGTRCIGIQRGVARPGTVHLDLECAADEFDREVERLLALGAAAIRRTRREPYGMIANLADPDGHPFDVCAYD